MARKFFGPEKQAAINAARQFRERRVMIQESDASPEVKTKTLAQARYQYEQEIAAIRADVQRGTERELSAIPGRMADAHKRKAEALGKILGEQTRFALLERWVKGSSPQELVSMVLNASDDWTKAALLELAELELRNATDSQADNARAALDRLEGETSWGARLAQVESEKQELLDIDAFLSRLDVQQQREVFASKLTIKESSLPDDACELF